VRENYAVLRDAGTGDTREELVSRSVIRKPKDVLAGAMVYDAITGGALGITDQVIDITGKTKELYGKYRPALPDGATLEDIIARPGEVIEVEFSETEDDAEE